MILVFRYYLSYKKLKRTIKRLEGDISGETKNSIGAVEEFKKSLNTELTRIDEFYQHKLAEYTKRLNNINNKYQEQTLNIHNNNLSLDTSHSDETKANEKSNKESFEPHIELAQLIHHQKSLLSALLAIKFQTLQLIQFREMNNKGVIKILKKADKRFNTSISPAFVSKMVITIQIYSKWLMKHFLGRN
ncbi:hypothetical protein K502DRAFT_31422 [Neoconidiobolus thromboides FSU 785]|nr:hypothetical protein K502DRAFT_31422 [Neoconidiobolus thromboides FSU 785]